MIIITLTVKKQLGYQEWANSYIKMEFKDEAFEELLGEPVSIGKKGTPNNPQLVEAFEVMANTLIFDLRQPDSKFRTIKEKK